ncbi:MAG: YlbF family regulator [Lachnospirales bacterium]
MEKVLKLADEISDILKNSETFVEYERAYNNIKDDKEIMKKISEMKKAHIEFATDYKNGNHDFDREKYISQEFNKLMLNKDVETYLLNEHRLVKTISEIYDKISESCNLRVLE